jgi:hypothetical protein
VVSGELFGRGGGNPDFSDILATSSQLLHAEGRGDSKPKSDRIRGS